MAPKVVLEMKRAAKYIIVAILGWQVRRLRKKHDFKIIGITGSIGKTSTKFAIASVLAQKYRVRFQEGNYNDLSSVPLIFFAQDMPSLFNPLAWAKVIFKNEKLLRAPYKFDFVILELGTDGPGQIGRFGRYLQLDMAVVTAISAEHMEHFIALDYVAREELSVSDFSESILINSDLCDLKYLDRLEDFMTYGQTDADYTFLGKKKTDNNYEIDVINANRQILHTKIELTSKVQLWSVVAAVAVGHQFDLTKSELLKGVGAIRTVSGRMQGLNGIKNSLIIDESYNSSPDAVKQALDNLYEFKSPQKIAVLGSMNELGDLSPEAHRQIGLYCDPKKMDLLITIGKDANDYAAEAARNKGCQVKTFDNPYAAGNYLREFIKEDAVVLVKGSQNGVFAEETIKIILVDPEDKSKLVRQNPEWLKIKQKQFRDKS